MTIRANSFLNFNNFTFFRILKFLLNIALREFQYVYSWLCFMAGHPVEVFGDSLAANKRYPRYVIIARSQKDALVMFEGGYVGQTPTCLIAYSDLAG